MIRNAIQMMERVLERNDRTKSARFSDETVINSINQAIEMVVSDRIDPVKVGEKRYSFQYCQRLRDELAPLIPAPATGAPASDIVPFPNDYKTYALLYVNVGSNKRNVKAITYNEEPEILIDPFTKPSDERLYFNERASGLRVLHGDTALGTYELWYVKNPAIVSIGTERDKVTAGNLTNATVYYVYEQAVYDNTILPDPITYFPGESFTASNTPVLVSGILIPASVIVSCDLPSALQDEVCDVAAMLLTGDVSDFYKKQSLQADANNS